MVAANGASGPSPAGQAALGAAGSALAGALHGFAAESCGGRERFLCGHRTGNGEQRPTMPGRAVGIVGRAAVAGGAARITARDVDRRFAAGGGPAGDGMPGGRGRRSVADGIYW